MKYLVDTSALVRLWRRQADPAWREFARRGLITVCEPVLAETLVSAGAKQYEATEEEFRDTYLVATIPAGIWDLTAVIRRELAPRSVHHGLSVTDLIVAATAIKLKLEVLHEDADFETMARFVPELRQRRVSAGP
ncbi:PIN domain-containing protein [Dactylosporangium sp. NPDC049525]|uniref:PIN domain-containing protein n=1 Tax=Dactylosporangium sp. NPDC049525 TaxID=3154730 RepID=UPI0034322EBD